MADINENEQSEVIRITGGDEEYIADVIQENGLNRLLVKSNGELNSDLRIVQYTGPDITMDDTVYTVVYSDTGFKTISGFFIEFDSEKVDVRLLIDGIEVFNINVQSLKDLSDWNNSPQPQTYVSYNSGLKVFYFTPNFPMVSQSSVSIEAKSRPGQSKKYKLSIVQVG